MGTNVNAHLSSKWAHPLSLIYRCTCVHEHTVTKKIAWQLLVAASGSLPQKRRVTRTDIERESHRHGGRFPRYRDARRNPTSTRQLFVHATTSWFEFLGRLAPEQASPSPFDRSMRAFEHFMRADQGLAITTIHTRHERIHDFLNTLPKRIGSLRQISVRDVDRYLILQSHRGWSRASLGALASSLRCFFRFAQAQRWCPAGIADAIESPRIYADEGLPRGPDWKVVQDLIASTKGTDPTSVRDRAVLMLLAVYGLRRGEVARLQLDDLDWDAGQIRLVRTKQRRVQRYPLIQPVANALAKYLREVRTPCVHREVFLAMLPPTRPMSPSAISAVVRCRIATLGVRIRPAGAHCLRHACARHLLAEGFTFKQIGDQLGHRCASTTLHYTKIDLIGLQQVAELSLRRVL